MQVLNLIKEFNMQKMKTTKKYNERLLGIVNNVRLIGTVFFNSRVVRKILVTIPEMFEAIISSLKNLKDKSSNTLAELNKGGL
jgi:ERCC4-type nuclease